MPLVISVFLFIFYFIIDNTGNKMARDGRIEVWEGMWLSTFILLPLGIFFTYKAVNDSAVFNKDAYVNFFNRLIGRREKRHIALKEVVMEDMLPDHAIVMVDELTDACRCFLDEHKGDQSYSQYWLQGYSRSQILSVSSKLEHAVSYMSNSRDKKVIAMLNRYPVLRNLWVYHPTRNKWVAYAAMAIFPVGLALFLWARRYQRSLRNDMAEVVGVNDRIVRLLGQDTAERN